uniref:Uncharacterized protein n=1 Tax=Arundo donax TaxID=35708 RepID=A0A0A8YGU3_ARUDO
MAAVAPARSGLELWQPE